MGAGYGAPRTAGRPAGRQNHETTYTGERSTSKKWHAEHLLNCCDAYEAEAMARYEKAGASLADLSLCEASILRAALRSAVSDLLLTHLEAGTGDAFVKVVSRAEAAR